MHGHGLHGPRRGAVGHNHCRRAVADRLRPLVYPAWQCRNRGDSNWAHKPPGIHCICVLRNDHRLVHPEMGSPKLGSYAEEQVVQADVTGVADRDQGIRAGATIDNGGQNPDGGVDETQLKHVVSRIPDDMQVFPVSGQGSKADRVVPRPGINPKGTGWEAERGQFKAAVETFDRQLGGVGPFNESKIIVPVGQSENDTIDRAGAHNRLKTSEMDRGAIQQDRTGIGPNGTIAG